MAGLLEGKVAVITGAGRGIGKAAVDISGANASSLNLEDYDKQTALTLHGVFLCMQAAIPVMLSSGGGSIVNVSSVGSLNVEDRAPAMYMAAKAAVNTQAVAVEYGRQGIRENVIAPGFTYT
jgi:NAD(P)-dependent dehydrogenase (short-subunit alcohol dehydrogenase family)